MTKSEPSQATLAQIACVLEATARKPGNVHRTRDFEDSSYLDYLLSAASITHALDGVARTGLGHSILAAIRSRTAVAPTNTNLGIVLLLAPLVAVPVDQDIREGVKKVIDSAGVADAGFVYEAIRLANPGGLNHADEQDVSETPTLPLREVMRLASERDMIARQYANDFADVLDFATPMLRDSLRRLRTIEAAIVRTFLEITATFPDTLIARKRDKHTAEEAARRARAVLDAGVTPFVPSALARFDEWLGGDGHARNPGTSADLTTAAVYLALREGSIALPLKREPQSMAAWVL